MTVLFHRVLNSVEFFVVLHIRLTMSCSQSAHPGLPSQTIVLACYTYVAFLLTKEVING